jgi:HSP20 family protein
VDIYEREGTLVLLLDLPGMRREDIGLEVEANGIVIEGERVRSDQARGLRLERPMGRFRRAFRIGVPIDPSQAQASYRDGVLEITAPKADISGPRRVKIDVA